MKDIRELLKEKCLKATPQRLAILTQIAKYGHISVEDIYNHIKNDFPSLSLATVYKNLHSLKDAEIVYEINTNNLKPMYEIKKQIHGHFICQVCKEVTDIPIDEEDFKKYPPYNQLDLYFTVFVINVKFNLKIF